MAKKYIIFEFSDENYQLKGTMTVKEFEKYMGNLLREDGVRICKEFKTDVNKYLKLAPKKEETILTNEVPLIPPTKRINWKREYFALKKEFEDFQIEVRSLILELKEENKVLNDRVNEQDKIILELKEENKVLKEENKVLKEKIAEQGKIIVEQGKKIVRQGKKIVKLQEKVDWYDKKYNYEYDRSKGPKHKTKLKVKKQ